MDITIHLFMKLLYVLLDYGLGLGFATHKLITKFSQIYSY